jgi:hypothetical protein
MIRINRVVEHLEQLKLLQTEDYEKEDEVRKKLKRGNRNDTYVSMRY